MITFDYPIVNNILLFQKGPLSQWYGAYKGQEHKLEIPPLFFPNSDLIWWQDINLIYRPISFNCCEQAMMFYKALLFRDKEIALKILALLAMEVSQQNYKPRLKDLKIFYDYLIKNSQIKPRNFYGCTFEQINEKTILAKPQKKLDEFCFRTILTQIRR